MLDCCACYVKNDFYNLIYNRETTHLPRNRTRYDSKDIRRNWSCRYNRPSGALCTPDRPSKQPRLDQLERALLKHII